MSSLLQLWAQWLEDQVANLKIGGCGIEPSQLLGYSSTLLLYLLLSFTKKMSLVRSLWGMNLSLLTL